MKTVQHINFIKIFAIFLVVFNHTDKYGYGLYTVSTDSPLYWFYIAIAVLCKVAVPLFFMCSGSLLLGKDESIKKIFVHRILRYAFILVLFSFIVYLNSIRENASSFSIRYFFETVYTKQICGSYWFLYTYLSALVMLPFLRAIAKNIDAKKMIYLASLHIVFFWNYTVRIGAHANRKHQLIYFYTNSNKLELILYDFWVLRRSRTRYIQSENQTHIMGVDM